MENSSSLVLLYRARDNQEAWFLKGALEGNGIKAHIFDENANSLIPHSNLFGPRIMVAAKDLENAKVILADNRINYDPSPEIKQTTTKATLLKRAFRTAMVGFFFLPGPPSLVAMYFLYRMKEAPLVDEVSKAKLFFTWFFIVLGLLFVPLYFYIFKQFGNIMDMGTNTLPDTI